MRAAFRGLGLVLLPVVALVAFGGQDPAVETRTFKLTYASAVEVAERLNGQMCREIGPDGKPFRVATAYEEANASGLSLSCRNDLRGIMSEEKYDILPLWK